MTPSSLENSVITIDGDALLREFDRIKSGGFKSLKEAFPDSRACRRLFPGVCRKAKLLRHSFKRTFGVLAPKRNRNEYKKQWAREHKESIRESRRRFCAKRNEKRRQEEQEAGRKRII